MFIYLMHEKDYKATTMMYGNGLANVDGLVI